MTIETPTWSETLAPTNRKDETMYAYAVVPSRGMYGNGTVVVLSLHRTLEAAQRQARRETQEYQDSMRPHGGSSGHYYAATWDRPGRDFWADAPPAPATEAD